MSMATTYTKVVVTEQYHWKRRVNEALRIRSQTSLVPKPKEEEEVLSPLLFGPGNEVT